MSLVRRTLFFIAPLVMLVVHACARGDVSDGFGAHDSGLGVVTTVTTAGLSAGSSETGAIPSIAQPTADSGSGGADTGADADTDGDCAEISEMAMKRLPADILLVIDNSGSMQIEAASVKANMNNFSTKIIDSGVDVHVVLLSSLDGKNGMCIDPPLGGGGCPAEDTKLPTFLHIDQKIGSSNALQQLLDHHDAWKGQMRPDARKHIVVVSDDNSDLGAEDFDAAFKALDPTYKDYVFHAIVGEHDATDLKWCAEEPECCDLTAAAGDVYMDLIDETDGVYGDLCKQDFTPVFDTLSSEVIQSSGLACAWAIPDPGLDQVIDFADVEVHFDDGEGEILSIDGVDTAAACADVPDGWYYDEGEPPTKLLVCPQTCDKIQLAPKGSMSIKFSCNPLRPQ